MLFPDAPVTIRIPFVYDVAFKARSWKDERRCPFASEVVVTVPAAEEAEAPVILRLADKGKDGYGRRPFSPREDGSPRRVRWHRDSMYLEWGTVDSLSAILSAKGDPKSTPFADTVRTAAFHAPTEAMSKLNGRRGGGREQPSSVHTPASLRRLESGIRYITDDGGAAVAARIREIAAMCLVVGDTVYEAIAEPVLVLDGYGERKLSLAVSTDAVPSPLRDRGSRDLSDERVFPVTVDIPATGARGEIHVEVLRPDLVLHAPHRGGMVKEAVSIVEELKSHAEELPTEWIGLASALGHSLSGAPPSPTPAMHAALAALADHGELGTVRLERMMELARRLDGPETRYSSRTLNSVEAALKAFAKCAAAARGLADRMEPCIRGIPFGGRLDPSTCTMTGASDDAGTRRLRQARTREDLRRAAVSLGMPFSDLERAMEADGAMDVVLIEARASYHGVRAGYDLSAAGAAVIDLEARSVTAVSGDAVAMGEVLAAHLSDSWAAADWSFEEKSAPRGIAP